MATDDGKLHLVWEAQRSEEEVWDNVWNGRLLAVSVDGHAWSEPRQWQDGGCCFTCDHRIVHAADDVRCAGKMEHDEQRGDFQLFAVDPTTAPDGGTAHAAPWRDWQPYRADPKVAASVTPGEPDPTSKIQRHRTQANEETLTLYFGDFHAHSIFSPDAEGFPDELYHFARDVAGLDFSGVTDNDFYPEKALLNGEVDLLKRLAARLEEPGRFLAFSGYEWTFHRDDEQESYNHRSIVFLKPEARAVRRIDVDGSSEPNMRRALKGMDVFAHAHHAQYELLGVPQEANVEVCSGWAVNLERSDSTHAQLNSGRRFGFLGGGDSHRMLPGMSGALAAVWARSLTRDGIAEALRNRRCYASSGNRTMIDFRLNGAMMGSVVHRPRERVFAARVQARTPLRRVSIIRDGNPVRDFDVKGCELEATWRDTDAPPGPAWYYLRVEDTTPWREHPHNVCQASGPWAWSSPIWVEGPP